MEPSVLLLLGIVIFLGSIFATIAGGGLGIVIIIVLTFFLDIRASVVLVSLIGFFIQPAKIYHFRQFADWNIVRWYVLTGIPASFLGGLMLFTLPQRIVEILLGIFCLCFAAFRLWHPTFRVEPRIPTLLGMGAVNGLQGGAVGEAMLLRSPFLLSLGLKKEAFVGTSSIIAFVMNIGKVTAYLPNVSWDRTTFSILAVALLPIFAGVAIGKRCLRFVSHNAFEKLLLCVITIGACKLLLIPS